MRARPVIATAMLVVGLAFLAHGLDRDVDRAVAQAPRCDGKPMSPGDTCIRIGPGPGSAVRDYDEMVQAAEHSSRSSYQTETVVSRVFAALLIPGSGYQFYRVFRPRRRRARPDRATFAARRGWSYVETDPEVLRGWRVGPSARGGDAAATRVIRGTYKGWPFAVFDYHWPEGEAMLATTMFVLNMPGISAPITLEPKADWWRKRVAGAPKPAGDDVIIALLHERFTVTVDDPAAAEQVLTWRVIPGIMKHLGPYFVYFDVPGLAVHQDRVHDVASKDCLLPPLSALAKVAGQLRRATDSPMADSS